ncbi:PREDICTED: mitochondrial ribosome-associated GTPase 2 isoform X2 [Trachymyrmex septentrionalis]|uniref:mitochondrial ribosome-associated GTPase 2 isoform X2 n=1 Tax=Trachymyrmex septentrionalis TaxID=34720 RepID=UPI00084F82B9|nr:PREDICTED: mitochondrial ribosome-associated GTPase 2 isoform X2 [Trachymyrmex septentrionalis]
MAMSIFNKNDSVLLIGEGNFSFSAALLRQNLNIELIATCYESGTNQEAAERNVDYLQSNGICVLFDVDATKLEECLSLKSRRFDKIIFNFPHAGGKMRIERNRDLLKDFFVSSERMIKENGQILVTLCNGQGGTPMDEPRRRWDDSWKIVEMAAHGNFILTRIEPFLWQSFQNYIVTGYRSLDKQFHTAGSLTHFFTKAELPMMHNIAPSNKIHTFKYTVDNITWKDMTKNIQDKLDIKSLSATACIHKQESIAKPLRSTKPKSKNDTLQHFVDIRSVKTIGGNGGDGHISFLRLWVNDRAGPDGGDGGHGGHVIFETTPNVKDLKHIYSVIRAEDGEKGYGKDCFGKNAEHNVVKVPIGTIVRDVEGKILADLNKEGMMFIAARGGAGGHGNAFFKSDTQQTPEICEYGAIGENLQYVLEIRSMAHIGLIGLPNAGKSTLLRAISRARPKIAAYPFTTLKPHIGIIQYDDYEQIAVADMPGLIEDSHKNRGLGITFLKHVERCAALVFILDVAQNEPWEVLQTLKYEISQFNERLNDRPHIIVANKIDLPNAEVNLQLLREHIDLPIIPISAKVGTNISTLLKEIRILYDNLKVTTSEEDTELLI